MCSGLAPAVLSLQTKLATGRLTIFKRTGVGLGQVVMSRETKQRSQPRLARQLKTENYSKRFYGLKRLQCHSARAVHGAQRL